MHIFTSHELRMRGTLFILSSADINDIMRLPLAHVDSSHVDISTRISSAHANQRLNTTETSRIRIHHDASKLYNTGLLCARQKAQ